MAENRRILWRLATENDVVAAARGSVGAIARLDAESRADDPRCALALNGATRGIDLFWQVRQFRFRLTNAGRSQLLRTLPTTVTGGRGFSAAPEKSLTAGFRSRAIGKFT